nr:hypothetical protein [Tanacetum cinerariifolium]
KCVLDSEGNPTTATEKVFETYTNVTQEIRDQLNAEAEAVQIILTGIDNDIYSIVDACLNACEMWKAIERLKQELECANVRGDLLSYKMEYERSYNKYTQTINDLNQTVLELTDKLSAHQGTISIFKQQKDAQIKLYKAREDKEIKKVIDLENKVKVLDNIVYKTGQSAQTMNMLNNKCLTSFGKPEFLKKAKQANPRLYDIGCYNDNLALMLSPKSDEDLKAQLQDKGIVLSELKKLIEKLKGKSVDTKFEK